MKHTWLAIGLFLIPFQVKAFDACDLILDPQIHLYEPTAEVDTSESKPVIERMNKRLSDLLYVIENGKGPAQIILKSIKPKVKSLLTEGRKLLQAELVSQERLFNFSYKFTYIIQYPTAFADYIGYRADGFDYVHSFTVPKFNERWEEFLRKWDITLEDMVKKYSRYYIKEYLTEAPEDGLRRTYLIDGRYKDEQKRNYFFQYQYIFLEGIASLSDLFVRREQGRFVLGVSRKAFAPYDGQHGPASAFLDHDLFHAFIAKLQDSLLFEELGVTTLDDAREVKKINHSLFLQALLDWQAIPDVKLRNAIELVLYAIIHEQGQSYPLQVKVDSKKRAAFYKKGILSNLKHNGFEEKHQQSLAIGARKYVDLAIKWVQERSSADAKKFYEEYRN